MTELHVDIETYSSIDLKSSGQYRYFQSVDFEILLIAYAFDDQPVRIIDLASGRKIPSNFKRVLNDPSVMKYAHNAAFERCAFNSIGLKSPVNQWSCTAIKAAYCGLPLSLADVTKVLGFSEDKAKLATGKKLITYFSKPCKPTKANGLRARNLPHHDPEKWEEYKTYCMQDVEAEREIERRLAAHNINHTERKLYILDQEINDRGIKIDVSMASNAVKMNNDFSRELSQEVKDITGVDNPNSPTQLKEWLTEATGKEIKSLAKDKVEELLSNGADGAVGEVLRLRQQLSKSSIKKYDAMLNCVCNDGRGHGFFQFYGANRTGRWAGRLVQLQNLKQNHLPDLDLARDLVKAGDLDAMKLIYGDVTDVLSQLIRTAFVADQDKTFAVADFSAIEARVIAWLAGENWRLDVFNTHGKIYEASGAAMFSVPIEQVTKGSDLRQKAKIAELALGYQGSLGALKTMGGERMGLSEPEMKMIVKRWRAANPAIVQLWKDLEGCAKQAIRTKRKIVSSHQGLVFEATNQLLTILLPSGRKLFYCNPRLRTKTVRKSDGDTFEVEAIQYMGMDQTKKQWFRLDTYGGKLAENIVQAIARDLLGEAMLRLYRYMFEIVMHVHDEAVCEIPKEGAEARLEKMCSLMAEPTDWSDGLPLAADGYLTDYYKKD